MGEEQPKWGYRYSPDVGWCVCPCQDEHNHEQEHWYISYEQNAEELADFINDLEAKLAEAITAREEAEEVRDYWYARCVDVSAVDLDNARTALAASEARAKAMERALREVLAYTPLSSKWKSVQDIARAALSTPEAQ